MITKHSSSSVNRRRESGMVDDWVGYDSTNDASLAKGWRDETRGVSLTPPV